jgi:hypothetical protein
MLFNYPSVVLLALFASTHASTPVRPPGVSGAPATHARDLSVIEARAKVTDMICPDGTILTSEQIAEAIRKAKTGQYGRYPVTFTNSGILSGAPPGELAEFPIMKTGVFSGSKYYLPFRTVCKRKSLLEIEN